jgi:hypothetical protein
MRMGSREEAITVDGGVVIIRRESRVETRREAS